jgi:hypothetical protein
MVAPVSLGTAVRNWHPRIPPLPEDLAALLRPEDPEWFARELVMAAAPPTRPTTAVAAYPGGVVPEDIP